MDLDDRVVDVDHHPLPRGQRHQRSPSGQPGQEPGRDGIELTDVTEAEGPQERPQGRGRIGVGEDPTHPTVTQQAHVIDAVRTGDHPRDQRGDLQTRVRTLVARHAQVLVREPRHFGALAGLGMIMQDIGDEKRALDAFRKALAVNPHLDKVPELVKTLSEKVEGRDI